MKNAKTNNKHLDSRQRNENLFTGKSDEHIIATIELNLNYLRYF